jgi:AraC-like DNA-binding protein
MVKLKGPVLFNPNDIPRAVFAVGPEIVTDGFEHPPHSHRKAQLLYISQGMISCEVAKGLWMVPPQCALWVPGSMQHSMRAFGVVNVYVLLIDPELIPQLPRQCCTVTVTPLLRELLIEVARLPLLYDEDAANERLIHVLLDRLVTSPLEKLHLPMPSDPRLRKIAAALQTDPATRATVGQWAKRIGLSERSLLRLLSEETGMSFRRWRQQFQITFALERLAEGRAVQTVAFDLGYESASAFITMFKRVLGKPPASFLASRKAHEAARKSPAPIA